MGEFWDDRSHSLFAVGGDSGRISRPRIHRQAARRRCTVDTAAAGAPGGGRGDPSIYPVGLAAPSGIEPECGRGHPPGAAGHREGCLGHPGPVPPLLESGGVVAQLAAPVPADSPGDVPVAAALVATVLESPQV